MLGVFQPKYGVPCQIKKKRLQTLAVDKGTARNTKNPPLSCRNHSKPHLRPTIPTADRSSGLLDSPALFPSFPSERLLNGVRSSPPTRLTSQPRARLPSNVAFPRRDNMGTGRVAEPITPDYSLGMGRGR